MDGREQWIRFLQWALPQLRLEWSGFRKVRGQCVKRIRRRMHALGLSSIEDYRRHLEAHPEEWPVLDGLCRITITRFWRDREVFERLRADVLPSLASSAGISGWSAGCASGEEPYSLVLAFELGPASASASKLRILATDADEALLERARRARYPRATLRELHNEWIERAFVERGGELELRPEYRSSVDFRRQDIRTELPDETFSLIACRNLVLTYFEPELRTRVLGALLDRLHVGGALIVGIHEKIPDDAAHRTEPWNGARAIYRRIA